MALSRKITVSNSLVNNNLIIKGAIVISISDIGTMISKTISPSWLTKVCDLFKDSRLVKPYDIVAKVKQQ